jgi:hypothetical protein
LVAVGNAAPPSPAIPASRSRSTRACGSSVSASTGAADSSRASRPSPSISMDGETPDPLADSRGPIATTRPEIGACSVAP